MPAQHDVRHHFIGLQVFLHRPRLDREIADGVDPRSTAEHAVRADQLYRRRRPLAAILGQIIDTAEGPSERGMGSGAKLEVEQIRASRTSLRAIQELLRGNEPVTAQGVALVLWLLSDVASPLYSADADATLDDAARRIAAVLARDDHALPRQAHPLAA
jgi:hypothetical protein